jgi:hypothetical protein
LRALLVVTGTAFVRAPAWAATPEELFQAGTAASERGDYEAAARAFDEAYALEPFAITKYNAAENWYEVPGGREAARAADAYRVALEADDRADEPRLKLAPALRGRATKRLAELAQRLCVVEATAPVGARVTVDRIEGVRVPTSFHLAPGTYEVIGTMDDTRRSVKIACRAGEAVHVAFPTERGPVAARPAAPEAPDAPEPAAAAGVDGHLVGGIVTMVAGGAFAGVAIGLGVRTLSLRDDFVETGSTNADLRDEAVLSKTLTTVSWVVSGVAHGVGLVVILTSPSVSSASSQASVTWPRWSLGLGPQTVRLDVAF